MTPESVSWEGDVDSLVVPAADGQLGVLPGHAPLLAQLQAGVLQIRTGEETKVLAVSGGFMEVFEGRVAVFAETAELADEINEERARQAAERAKAAMRGPSLDDEQSEAALKRAMIRMKVVELSRRRTSHTREKPPRPH